MIIQPDLTIPGHPSVFVVGDLASLKIDGNPVPGVAPAALQEGAHAAQNILRAIRGEALEPFQYKNKGSLATIGRSAAVADFGKFKLSGATAWLAWLGVHILFLIGFRNRFVVLFEWAWSFISYDRGARLITGPLLKVWIDRLAFFRSRYKCAAPAIRELIESISVWTCCVVKPSASITPEPEIFELIVGIDSNDPFNTIASW
jgi:hypothetical protein